MGDVAGFGDGAHIDKVTDAVGVEECDELFDGVRGVADGEDDVLRHYLIVMRAFPPKRSLDGAPMFRTGIGVRLSRMQQADGFPRDP